MATNGGDSYRGIVDAEAKKQSADGKVSNQTLDQQKNEEGDMTHGDDRKETATAPQTAKRRSSSGSQISLKRPPSEVHASQTLDRPPKAQKQDTGQKKKHVRSRGKGRARLPEKMMEYLNAEVVPDVLWWLPGEDAFALESSRAQKEILDVYFRGTKLASFVRSLNRWGFRRIFLHSLPKTVMCFHHKLFKKKEPHQVKGMELSSYEPKNADDNKEFLNEVTSATQIDSRRLTQGGISEQQNVDVTTTFALQPHAQHSTSGSLLRTEISRFRQPSTHAESSGFRPRGAGNVYNVPQRTSAVGVLEDEIRRLLSEQLGSNLREESRDRTQHGFRLRPDPPEISQQPPSGSLLHSEISRLLDQLESSMPHESASNSPGLLMGRANSMGPPQQALARSELENELSQLLRGNNQLRRQRELQSFRLQPVSSEHTGRNSSADERQALLALQNFLSNIADTSQAPIQQNLQATLFGSLLSAPQVQRPPSSISAAFSPLIQAASPGAVTGAPSVSLPSRDEDLQALLQIALELMQGRSTSLSQP